MAEDCNRVENGGSPVIAALLILALTALLAGRRIFRRMSRIFLPGPD